MSGSHLYIAIFLLMLTAVVFPQQSKEKSDSTSQQKIPFQYYMLNYQLIDKNSFRISPGDLLPFNNTGKMNNSSFTWLERDIAMKELNDKINLENKLPSILTRPLTLKYQSEEKLTLIWGILEQIKTIFVFYLAYKHIEKYGPFH